MDLMNLMITHDTFRQFFNVDLNPPNPKSVDKDIKEFCRKRIKAFKSLFEVTDS